MKTDLGNEYNAVFITESGQYWRFWIGIIISFICTQFRQNIVDRGYLNETF